MKGETVRYAPILDGKTVAVGQIGVMSEYQSSGQIFAATPTVEVTGGKAYQLSDYTDTRDKAKIPSNEAYLYFRGGSFKAVRSLTSNSANATPISKTFDPDTCVSKGNYCYPSLKIDELLSDKAKTYATDGDEICQLVPADGSDYHNYTPSIDGVSINDLFTAYSAIRYSTTDRGGHVLGTDDKYNVVFVPVFAYNSFTKKFSGPGAGWLVANNGYSTYFETLDITTLTDQDCAIPIVSKVFSD